MDEVFVIYFHGRISYTEVMNMPIWRRRWMLPRIRKEFERLYGDKQQK